MESIWSKKMPEASKTQEKEWKQKEISLPERTGAAVIGGGMAGILCAWLLKEAGVETVVLEAETVGSGQSKNTTAKITAQHELIYHQLKTERGEEAAGQYARAGLTAIDEYERIIKEKKISCGFSRLPAFLYTKTDQGAQILEAERTAAKQAGIRASVVYETDLPFPVKAALKFEDQAQFSPLEFLYALKGDLKVFEHTRVQRVRGHEIFTDRGNLKADHIIFATHFPFPNWPGLYFMKMHQERSYVLAVEKDGGPDLHGVYYGIDPDGISIREAGDCYLVGGESHRTGYCPVSDPEEDLRKKAAEVFGEQRRETAIWAAQDCMTLDSIPYIGRFSRLRPDWYVATGFGKWGMTNSMVSAMAIRDMVTGKENPDWAVFSPQRRPVWKTAGNQLKEWYHSSKNMFLIGGPRCRHLGCKLKWNRAEHTWDCPCHGSRFSAEGRLIDNPAQKNLKTPPDKAV